MAVTQRCEKTAVRQRIRPWRPSDGTHRCRLTWQPPPGIVQRGELAVNTRQRALTHVAIQASSRGIGHGSTREAIDREFSIAPKHLVAKPHSRTVGAAQLERRSFDRRSPSVRHAPPANWSGLPTPGAPRGRMPVQLPGAGGRPGPAPQVLSRLSPAQSTSPHCWAPSEWRRR